MTDLERVRARISAVIEDITETQRALGVDVSDPGDREAHDIVARIERRVRALEAAK